MIASLDTARDDEYVLQYYKFKRYFSVQLSMAISGKSIQAY